ncbi:hypothetical protein [Rhizobium sp.]|uniref:hypothetical protein n=2 Tax=Rhizobium TaxID=379 RepID=UPI0034C673AE
MAFGLKNSVAAVACAHLRYTLSINMDVCRHEESIVMPGKQWLIGFADQSKRQCHEQLQRTIDAAVQDLLQDGSEPQCIAEALLEIADNYFDTVIGDMEMTPPTPLH